MKRNLNIGLICISLGLAYFSYSVLAIATEIRKSRESLPAIMTHVKATKYETTK